MQELSSIGEPARLDTCCLDSDVDRPWRRGTTPAGHVRTCSGARASSQPSWSPQLGYRDQQSVSLAKTRLESGQTLGQGAERRANRPPAATGAVSAWSACVVALVGVGPSTSTKSASRLRLVAFSGQVLPGLVPGGGAGAVGDGPQATPQQRPSAHPGAASFGDRCF